MNQIEFEVKAATISAAQQQAVEIVSDFLGVPADDWTDWKAFTFNGKPAITKTNGEIVMWNVNVTYDLGPSNE